MASNFGINRIYKSHDCYARKNSLPVLSKQNITRAYNVDGHDKSYNKVLETLPFPSFLGRKRFMRRN